MSVLVASYPVSVRERSRRYVIEVYAEKRADGRYEAWIEFIDEKKGDRLLTGAETTQRTLRQIRQWAAGITPAYLEGAFARARMRFGVDAPRRFSRSLARRLRDR